MAEEVLVGPLSPALIDAGRNLLSRLETAHFPVSGALWMLMPGDSAWRLFIISDAADSQRPIKLYETVLKHAPTSAYPFWPSIIKVLSPREPLALDIRNALRDTPRDADESEEGETWIGISPSDVAHAYVYKRW